MIRRVLSLAALVAVAALGCGTRAEACPQVLAFSQCYSQPLAVQQYSVLQYAAPLAVQVPVYQQQVLVQKQYAVRQQAVVAYPQAVVAYSQAVVVEQRAPRRQIVRQRTVIRNR